MPAIRPHSTETSGGPWDGPPNEARLRLDQEPEYYRQAYAWYDPEGNARAKAAYRFIHHEVDNEGTIGPANIRACVSAIGVLNGARGGANIPDADRVGVWRHLARHLEDAGVEVPALRGRLLSAPSYERRAWPISCEVRQDGNSQRLSGYAAVFGVTAEVAPGLGLYEKVAPGAFRKTLQERDVVALWNHDSQLVLGRISAGTLELSTDERGLKFSVVLPHTSYASDLVELVRRGDISGASFGFRTIRDSWDGDVRQLDEVDLYEISVVAFPAYPQTTVALRALFPRKSERELLELAALGVPLSRDGISRLRHAVELLAGDDSGAPGTSDAPPATATQRLALRRRRLELALQCAGKGGV